MFPIVSKRTLNTSGTVLEYVIKAPLVSRKCLPGQFVILRLDEKGERIPLTIADYDREAGTVTIMVQPIGQTTKMLALMEAGDALADVVGPLGKPTEMDNLKRVAVVGGGVGCAIAYPVAKGMWERGVEVDMIAGFRSKDIVILEDEMRQHVTNLYICTDDGSYGEKCFGNAKLEQLIKAGREYDRVFIVGPLMMMKFTSLTTKPYNIETICSLAPVMVDGSGMCGGCRVTVAGETKFACVDGPEFDGHQVDWDEIIARGSFYAEEEKERRENHVCRLTGGVRHG